MFFFFNFIISFYLFLGERSKYPTTPPPHKKHQTGVTPLVPALLSDLSLTKSRSHESQLGYSENNQIGK